MGNIQDKIDVVMREISDYGSSFKSTISELLAKGAVYDQVKWERDIAISQLNDLGIGFGEDITKYKIAIKNIPHMTKENVMYTVCNTEWGLDARYVCPECLQPVEYETRYQTIEEFFDMVNKAMDDLRNSGAKKISVQYLTETHTQEINRAIITYMI